MVHGGLKFERSTRRLFEANVMELTGPLTMQDFGVGRMVTPGEVGAPYADWLSLDIDRLKDWRNYSQSLIKADPDDFANEYVEDGTIATDEDSYDSREDRIAGYAMAKGVFGNVDVIGGLRIDHTRVASDNFELIELEDQDPILNAITGKASYTSFLPRAQVNWRPSDNTVLRAAVFTSIARPDPMLISGATEIEEDDGELEITVGNPGLRPAYAWNFDASVEHYFGSVSVISAGVFYKRINGFIFSALDREVDGETAQFEGDPRLEGREIASVTTFANGKSAEIYGVEFNLVRQFSALPGALGGWACMPTPPSSAAAPIPGWRMLANPTSSTRRKRSSTPRSPTRNTASKARSPTAGVTGRSPVSPATTPASWKSLMARSTCNSA